VTDPRTERLDAERPSSVEHLDFLTALFADPEIARWHWPDANRAGGPRTAEQSREFHLRSIDDWEKHGYGWWLWRDRERDTLVARVGLAWTTVDGERAVELGWSVPVAEQGRGYASEAAIASLDFAFAETRLEEIVSFTWTENAASQRVMEKAGFSFERGFKHANLPHVLYLARGDLRRSQT
jgi:ribosomal-protein-alanine N-acetyltransferase